MPHKITIEFLAEDKKATNCPRPWRIEVRNNVDDELVEIREIGSRVGLNNAIKDLLEYYVIPAF